MAVFFMPGTYWSTVSSSTTTVVAEVDSQNHSLCLSAGTPNVIQLLFLDLCFIDCVII